MNASVPILLAAIDTQAITEASTRLIDEVGHFVSHSTFSSFHHFDSCNFFFTST